MRYAYDGKLAIQPRLGADYSGAEWSTATGLTLEVGDGGESAAVSGRKRVGGLTPGDVAQAVASLVNWLAESGRTLSGCITWGCVEDATFHGAIAVRPDEVPRVMNTSQLADEWAKACERCWAVAGRKLNAKSILDCGTEAEEEAHCLENSAAEGALISLGTSIPVIISPDGEEAAMELWEPGDAGCFLEQCGVDIHSGVDWEISPSGDAVCAVCHGHIGYGPTRAAFCIGKALMGRFIETFDERRPS